MADLLAETSDMGRHCHAHTVAVAAPLARWPSHVGRHMWAGELGRASMPWGSAAGPVVASHPELSKLAESSRPLGGARALDLGARPGLSEAVITRPRPSKPWPPPGTPHRGPQ